MASLANNRQGKKVLLGANTLAYLAHALVNKEKFLQLWPLFKSEHLFLKN